MEIPKIIHQTWYKKNLPDGIKRNVEKIKKLNPDYEYRFYDDNDILDFIKKNYDSETLNVYKKLVIGASKADFFRYLVIYKTGGIYLDIDSVINKNLDSLIKNRSGVISREKNKGYFLQWMMVFCKEHPFLKKIINITMSNIANNKEKDICLLTGPWGPYSQGITEILRMKDLWWIEDTKINEILKNNEDEKIKNTVFYGMDYGDFAEFKNDGADESYGIFKLHWKTSQDIYNNRFKYISLIFIIILFFILIYRNFFDYI